MRPPGRDDLTRLLQEWGDGSRDAVDDLLPLVWSQLRRLAAGYMRRERPRHTLQVTELVNEAYVRLAEQRDVRWQNRSQFFALAAQAMRRVLVDHARQRARHKRGAGIVVVPLDEARDAGPSRSLDLVRLDDALTELERLDPRQSRVVELRYFVGLSIAETASVLGLSVSTVKREWETARMFLTHQVRAT